MNSAIRAVRRSGRMRSSNSELASISRPFGSSWASMSASEKGCTGSRGWPITSAGGVEGAALGAVRRRAAEEDPLQHAALGPGSWRRRRARARARAGRSLARDRAGARVPTRFMTGSPNVSASSSGVNASAQAGIALSSTGISMHHRRAVARARVEATLERDVGAQRGAADDRLRRSRGGRAARRSGARTRRIE